MATSMKRKELEAALVKRALTDVGFRKTLLTNPNGALQSFLDAEAPGATVPAGLEIKAFEEPHNAFYIVVPHGSAELSAAELEQAAGGGGLGGFDPRNGPLVVSLPYPED